MDDEAFIPATFDQTDPSPELDLDAAAAQFMLEGGATTSPVVHASLLERLSAEIGELEPKAGLRNPLDISPAARTLASSMAVRHIPEAALGAGCFVTRAFEHARAASCSKRPSIARLRPRA